MHRHAFLAAATFATMLGIAPATTAHAQRADGPTVWQMDDGRVVVEGDRVYENWSAYFRSPVFRAFGMRCGTPEPTFDEGDGGEGGPGQQSLLGSPADCGNTTNPADEYDPSVGTLYRIPVVVHVIRNDAGTQGDISPECVENQIDILNEDYRAIFGSNGEGGYDARVEFFLAETDPDGDPTDGITYSNNTTWFNDGGSYWNSLAWDPNRYLNIYTNTAGGALGYVPFLPHEGSPGALSDRVVCLWSAFGDCDTAQAPFDLGRTLTHEVGHYLGLFHTFDNGCGTSNCNSTGDRICDTNPQQSPNYECPGSASSCSTSDPIANYMNYTDDACMNQFTEGQSRRMRCTIVHYRATLPCDGCDDDADSDGDGVPNGSDNCPAVANADQADTDGDGVGDACDGCPTDPDRTEPGDCGCNAPADDTDGDGVIDCEDGCPNDPNKTEPGPCGCGLADADSDGDGTLDCNDACPNDPYTAVASGGCGCGSIDADVDGDGVLDCDGVVFDVGTFNLSGGQSASVALEGYVGTMTGFAIAFDYDGGGGTWASDMVAAFGNGSNGVEVGGYNADFGYESLGAWSFDGSGSAADGVYSDAMEASLPIIPGQTFKFRIMNGWSSAPSTEYANVRIVVFGIVPDNPCAELAATATTTAFGSDGASGATLSISTGEGCAWTASSDSAWVTLSAGSGSGDAALTFDVALNGTAVARTAVVTVDSDGADAATISISQEANACAADSDGDGVGDCDDGCPSDPGKTSPGACGCGVADSDSDGDGTPDCNDGCPTDANKTSPGACGCGVADTDSDGDGTADCDDGCPTDPDKTSPGTCGCGVADADSDGDGTLDCNDGCPSDPNKTDPGTCGCGVDDASATNWWPDVDGDGYGDATAIATSACVQPAGFVGNDLDCDDVNAAINPNAVDICGDGLDNDCNGEVDETCSGAVGFLGFTGEIVETVVNGVRYASMDVYANFDSTSVEVVNVYDSTVANAGGSAFVQNDFAGGTWSPSLTDPSLEAIDSYVTVGGEAGPAAGNTTSFDPSFPDGTVAVPPAGAGWFNSNPTNLQGFSDEQGRVRMARYVIAMTSTEDVLSFTASISFAGYPGGDTQQQSASVEVAWPTLPPVEFLGLEGVLTEFDFEGVSYARVDLYAAFNSASVEVVNVYSTDIANAFGTAFVQNDFAGGTWSPVLSNPATMVADSFVTVGGDLASPSSNTTTFDPGFPDAGAEAPPVGAGWYNSNPANLQGFTDVDGRVLIGRFTIVPTAAEDVFSATASLTFAGYPDGATQQQTASTAVAWPVSPCPADFDGNGVVDGADLGFILLDWGTASPASDLDGSGIVDGADIGLMLLDWGGCL